MANWWDAAPLAENAPKMPSGMLERGNIDLTKRPVVRNSDGSISTVRSIGVNMDGAEYLLPTVSDDGRIITEQDAVDTFRRTGRHLGKFDTPQNSTAYAESLHLDQAKQYAPAAGSNWWEAAPLAQEAPASVSDRFDAVNDGGVAKQAPQRSVASAVTDIPSEIAKAAGEGWNNVAGITKRGGQGPIDGLLTTGKAIMGIPQIALSPITGTARSVLGRPIAEAETAVGGLIDPRTAALRDAYDLAYKDASASVDTALAATGSRGVPVRAVPVAPVQAPSAGQSVVDAASRLSNVVGDVNVPRAIASDSVAVQRIGQGIRNIPVVGDAIPKSVAGLTDDLGNAVRTVADQYGTGSGPNVASRIGNRLGDAADAERAIAEAQTLRSDAAAMGDWERFQQAGNAALDARDATAFQRAQASVGDMSPQDMGAALIQRLRSGEAAAQARKNQLYDIAGNSDASISADAVGGIRARVAQQLENDGRVVDGVLTPASSRMMDELQRFSGLDIENRAVGARPPVPAGEMPVRAAVNVQGIEQTRKRLSAMSQAAANDADRAAARRILREFDNWESDAFDNALFSGSPEALANIRRARDANREWRQSFYNNRDDADRLINRVVTGEVTPQEMSNWLVGASQVGAKGVSSRLLTRLAEVTGNDAQAMEAIRGGVWNRLSQTAEGVTQKAPAKIADSISEFLNGSGRDVANRLFTPQQRGIMQAYGDTLRSTAQGRRDLADVASNTRPGASEAGIGPMQQLAADVLGRGGKTDEALFTAIDAYAKSGGRGDVQTLARIVRSLPEGDRGDLAGAIVRQLGISPKTQQFSPDVFATQWQSYTPQAKALLFGNAGPHRQALDDIMTISQRLKQVGQRFGNPSGTAQNANFAGLGAGLVAAPLTTLSTAVGGAIAARILAAPAAASSAAKWSRAYAAVQMRPTAHTIAAYQTASRNLANTAQGLGSNATSLDFMKALQAPATSGAQEQDQIPRPPGQ